jgi:protein dithiol:quinone oxidoreductase
MLPAMIAFRRPHLRLAFLTVAVVSTTALLVAAYLQHVLGQRPCPLCIAQRYAFIVMAIAGVAGAMLVHVTLARRVLASMLSLACGAGLFFAVKMVFFTTDASGCAADAIAVFINDLAIAQMFPQYFFADGGCTDQYPPFLGMSVPVWGLILFFAMIDIAALLTIANDKE